MNFSSGSKPWVPTFLIAKVPLAEEDNEHNGPLDHKIGIVDELSFSSSEFEAQQCNATLWVGRASLGFDLWRVYVVHKERTLSKCSQHFLLPNRILFRCHSRQLNLTVNRV